MRDDPEDEDRLAATAVSRWRSATRGSSWPYFEGHAPRALLARRLGLVES